MHRGHLALPRAPHPFIAPLRRHHWWAAEPWGSVPRDYLDAAFLFSQSEVGFASPYCFVKLLMTWVETGCNGLDFALVLLQFGGKCFF
jgi:hypothetical protein